MNHAVWTNETQQKQRNHKTKPHACFMLPSNYQLLDVSSACLSRMFFMFFREPVFVTVLNLLLGMLSLLNLIL